MKKLIHLIIIFLSFSINAQIVVRGVSPSSVAGINFDFTWADPNTATWSATIPDFNLTNTSVQDTLALVYDPIASTGNNPAYAIPHAFANEGCADSLGNPFIDSSVNGKIAVVWRGSCQFGYKAAVAENNGAVAIIIINHSGAPVGMAGGDSGVLAVNIPVVMISTTDGQTLINEMSNGPVEIFMGNKLGSQINDVGSSKDVANISKYASVPVDMVQNGNNNFDLGLTITNFGSDDNTPVLNQSISGPNGYLYSDTITYGVLPALQDTDYIYSPFTDTNLTVGEYTINYDLSILNEIDQDSADNNVTASFNVTNNVLSRARTDENTGQIVANYWPHNYTTNQNVCMHVYEDEWPYAYGAEGIYFSADTDSSLVGEYMIVSIYEWNDPVSGAFGTWTQQSLNPVLYNDYVFADDSLKKQIVYHEFTDDNLAPTVFKFQNYQRYLVCLEYDAGISGNLDFAFGYDSYLDYGSNTAYNPELGPAQLNIDGVPPYTSFAGDWYTGWSGADAPSIGLKMAYSYVGIDDINDSNYKIYPNPTNSIFNIGVKDNNEKIKVEIYDMTGRKVISTKNVVSQTITLNVNNLQSGHYIVKIINDSGKVTTMKMVKK
ncbi:MAG: PA domain-containing protein [Parvicellaceae bacterium]